MHSLNHPDTFVMLIMEVESEKHRSYLPGVTPDQKNFTRASRHGGDTPRKFTPGVTPGVLRPSLNDNKFYINCTTKIPLNTYINEIRKK